MAIIGNGPTSQSYVPGTDYFNGTGSQTSFTLSRPVLSVYAIQAVIENVVQNPSSAYTVNGSTITFTSAPPAGTNNIYVTYTSLLTQVNVLSGSPSVVGPMLVSINNANALGGATNPIVGMSGSANNYVQSYVLNSLDALNASADFAAYPSNGLDSSGWIDMGITGPTFGQAAFSVTGPNEAYLFGSAPAGSNTSGNLVIATDSTGLNNAIQFYTNGFNKAKSAAAVTIDANGNLGIGTSSPSTFSANSTYSTQLAIVKTDQSTTLGAYYQSGITQYAYINSANAANNTANPLVFSNGANTERMRIDVSGNLGIGTASPAYKLDINGSVRVGSPSSAYSTFLNSNANWNYDELIIQRNSSNTSNVRFMGLYLDGDTTGNTNFSAYPSLQVAYSGTPTTGSTSIGLSASLNIATVSSMTFSRNVSGTSTESMRIDSSGRLLVGTTTPYDVNSIATFSNSNHAISAVTTTTGGGWYAIECGRTGSTGKFIGFTYPGPSTEVGSISYNGTNTLYNATSDQRLKENIVDAETAFETINKIKIRSFDWIESKVHETHGVIAQELQQIAPQCVTEGTTNEDGSMGSPWQVDTSPLIPLLTKAIQELKALVDTQANTITQLQADVAVLKGAK